MNIPSMVLNKFSLILQITLSCLVCIVIIIIILKQNNVIERFLLNLVFLMVGTISAISELYLAVTRYTRQPVYLKLPILFSLLFISLLLILMLYNMYFVWKDINSFQKIECTWKKVIYNNRFAFFILNIIIIVLIVLCFYGFIYYIINNLPPSIALDLKDNFMDNGARKSFGECLYFSAVTFFTVGYGDMVPNGMFFFSIVLLEMTTSYLLTIISIPLLLSILINNLRISK